METDISKKNRPKKVIKSDNLFPVVGIGASAGGLNAFKMLLHAIPEDSGMAFVLVQHLDPRHISSLPEILQKSTKIPVLEITNDCKVEPNHIYVMPSNKVLVANDGVLLLSQRPSGGKNTRNLPIDLLFTSLAEVHQSHAIGIVLSGTASDGTLGLKAIKENGGLTFAQDEESTEYNGMPSSAIQANVVDFILPPDKMPDKLLEVTRIISTSDDLNSKATFDDKDVIQQIISLLRLRKGVDFTYYKQTTIHRRILRRIALSKLENTVDYLEYLKDHKHEQDILFQDFLIPVTSFFRDPNTFENLTKTILPSIFKNAPEDDYIRIWVAGCSTGEEAYSLAICFSEYIAGQSLPNAEKRIQIFASDLSELAINKARPGIYSRHDLDGVSPRRLDEYFIKTHDKYQVNRKIRDMCVFACHDFLKDPPFSRINLISCRNVLIYMDPYLQKKALTTFHYALNPKGIVLLGKTETTGVTSDLFDCISKIDKIFSRKDVPGTFMHLTGSKVRRNNNETDVNSLTDNKYSDFRKTADEILLNEYTPAGVIVNDSLDIIQFRGITSSYLEQSPGKPTHNLLLMAKHGLSFELRNLVHKAKKKNASTKKENIPVNINQGLQNICIEAIPLPNTIEPHYLILFHDRKSNGNLNVAEVDPKSAKRKTNDGKDLRILQLEQELLEAREDMRSITEEQEAANEELQGSNEELLSGSEELQSLNEELEASKEELQSINEELIVINDEMVSLNNQISAEKKYSDSIVANIREPLLVLDKKLKIKSANNAFYKLFKLTEEEIEGVLIFDLNNQHWDHPKLRTLLEKVIPEKSHVNDFELTQSFPNIGKLNMLLNAREVITESNSEKLILLSIENNTEKVIARKKIEVAQKLHTRDLEDKIKERTAELKNTNLKLLQKNNDLEKINKELESFAYVSSHDLQEPLRKIQTFAGRILEKENQNLSENGKTYFSIMQSSAGRMQKLIEDLLSFSRLNTAERKFEKIDLKEIVEQVTSDLKEIIKEKNAIIESKELCKVNIIGFQFHQLMFNLISNSLKFSKPDVPPYIVIKCDIKKGKSLRLKKDISPDIMYCHISVSDNGIGIESEFSAKIFEVFQKLHGKDEYPGTGIGLATVKKIVDNHHGFITVSSKLNKGATFNIYFPAYNN